MRQSKILGEEQIEIFKILGVTQFGNIFSSW